MSNRPQAKSIIRKDYSPTKKPNTTTLNSSNVNQTPSNFQLPRGLDESVYKPISTRILNIDKLLDDESKQASFGENFQDYFFPCTNESLSNDFKNTLNIIEWLRPREICESFSVEYNVENIKSNQPLQQQLGDCWMVCACYALFSTMGNNIFKRIFVQNASGRMVFRFFVQGASNRIDKFINISIDDRLPVKITNKNLIYGCCVNRTQFWFSLLEKAYAKLYGSNYENIVAGIPEEAFIDLCGAFTLYLNPQFPSDTEIIKEKLINLKRSNNLISCADTIPLKASVINNASNIQIETKKSHSFVITDIIKNRNEIIIQLKNLWASSNIIFKELWSLNCNKNRSNNGESDYSELSLKFKDFQTYFGAITFVVHIPDYENLSNKNEFQEICSSFSKTYSVFEIISNHLNLKESFIDYLYETSDFYLLKVKPNRNSFELLFNLTQYSNCNDREKLRLSFTEVNENGIANYSKRIETNRKGRTISKLLLFNSDKAFTYIISATVISNDKEMGKNLALNYLFRVLHLELNEIELRKLNYKLEGENVKLDVNSCKTCTKVLLNELNEIKIHKVDGEQYCDDCYIKRRFERSSQSNRGDGGNRGARGGGLGSTRQGPPSQNLISGFKALMDDYNALM